MSQILKRRKLKHKLPLAASEEMIPLIKLSPASETKPVLYEQPAEAASTGGKWECEKVRKKKKN